MPASLKHFYMSLGMPLINMYGLSETAGPTTYMDISSGEYSLEKGGKAFPGTEIKIFNPDENGVGEICLRGRNVFMGYLNNSTSTVEVLDPVGFFHTGDLGYLDDQGFLEITGR